MTLVTIIVLAYMDRTGENLCVSVDEPIPRYFWRRGGEYCRRYIVQKYTKFYNCYVDVRNLSPGSHRLYIYVTQEIPSVKVYYEVWAGLRQQLLANGEAWVQGGFDPHVVEFDVPTRVTGAPRGLIPRPRVPPPSKPEPPEPGPPIKPPTPTPPIAIPPVPKEVLPLILLGSFAVGALAASR